MYKYILKTPMKWRSGRQAASNQELTLTCVTGLSLQTNKTFSGGLISASGISANCTKKVLTSHKR